LTTFCKSTKPLDDIGTTNGVKLALRSVPFMSIASESADRRARRSARFRENLFNVLLTVVTTALVAAVVAIILWSLGALNRPPARDMIPPDAAAQSERPAGQVLEH